eukprot:UN18913
MYTKEKFAIVLSSALIIGIILATQIGLDQPMSDLKTKTFPSNKDR